MSLPWPDWTEEQWREALRRLKAGEPPLPWTPKAPEPKKKN